MKKVNVADVPVDIVREPGAKQATIRRLIDMIDGADRFVLSLFELGSNGSTPPHYHDWEHEIYVLSGTCKLLLPDQGRDESLKPGDVIFIPRNVPHGFVTGPDEFCKLLCVAPADRPPTRNVFLSDEPWRYDPPPQS